MIKLLIFDLDNTLYEEKKYVESGFKAVAKYLHKETGIVEKKIFNALITSLKKHGRGKNFDFLLKKFPGIRIKKTKLIKIYRSHSPSISLSKSTENALKKLKKKYKLCLLTNGWPIVQKNKVKKLKLEKIFDKIFYPQGKGMEFRKPDKRCFIQTFKYFGVKPQEAMMIGDDVVADIEGAEAVGIKTFLVEKVGDISSVIQKN